MQLSQLQLQLSNILFVTRLNLCSAFPFDIGITE